MKRSPAVRLSAAIVSMALSAALAGGIAESAAASMEALSINPPHVLKNTPPASAIAIIRGIGFTPATTVKFDTVSAAVTFIDSRTLQVQVPTVTAGKAAHVFVTEGGRTDDIFPFIYTDQVLFVKTTGNDNSNGSTPALAKKTIGGALAAASTSVPSWIKVAAGTYNESALALFTGNVVQGGWDPNFVQRDPDQLVTVVDAGRVGFAMRSGGIDAVQVVDGLTIRNGVRDGLGGGAFIISGDNTVITNSVMVGNTSSSRGGAVYAVFTTSYGGTPVLSNNVMVGNRTFSNSGGAVGVYPFYTQGQVVDFAISDNYIVGNRSFSNRGGGVGLGTQAQYTYNLVRLQLVGNVIGGNQATSGAGVSVVAAGAGDNYDLLIDDNLVFGNEAQGEAGGLLLGGVGHVTGHVTGNTFAENVAGLEGGGGIRFSPSLIYEPTFEAKNLIAWGNANGNLVGAPLATFSDVEGGAAGTGNIAVNPRFVTGPMGRFYLAQDANTLSPAVDSGSGLSVDLSMDALSTSAVLSPDTGMVDMGSHYPFNVGPSADPIAFGRIDPAQGDFGGADWALIRGRGFDPGASVTFDGMPAIDSIYVSATRLLARPPAHALGAVNVVVTNPDLTAVTAPGAYTYVDNLPPVWPTTVGLQQILTRQDCVRSATLLWNPAADAATPPVSYSIYKVSCVPPSTGNFQTPCDNFGFIPSATDLIGTTTERFFVDTAFGTGGADPKFIYLIRAADAVTPVRNVEFNYSKRVVTVGKITTDTIPPSPVGDTFDLPGGNFMDWAGAPGAINYRVYRQANASSYATPASLTPLIILTVANNDLNADGVTDSQYTDTALPAAGAAFFYKITAVDPCGIESASDLLPGL